MTRVIAVQEDQIKLLRENYSKNLTVASTPLNNADVLSDSLATGNVEAVTNKNVDMEGQVVNLNVSQPQNIAPSIVNSQATSEVFGTAFASTPFINGGNSVQANNQVVTTPNNDNFVGMPQVPYQEPILSNLNSAKDMSDDEYFDLLNSLRNMITDFANSAYSAIDKFQEERLQTKKTGASLVNNAESVLGQEKNEEMVNANPIQPAVGMNSPVTNIFDSQASSNLDETMVIPANVMANAINEADNGIKMVA